MEESLSSIVRKHALANAHAHGKASVGAVVGKVIAEYSSAKEDLNALRALVAKEVDSVNALSASDIERELGRYTFAERKEEERKYHLPGVEEGKVVTRFLPEPNGYPHIGHAKAAWLSRELASQWRGTCVLRFDDTNPEAEKQEYVDAVLSDVSWLGISFDGPVQYSSDYIGVLHAYAEHMLSSEKAYVCTCSEEEVKASRETGRPCACRERPEAGQVSDFNRMREGGFAQGEAVVRFKGDLTSANTAMRDPTLLRILTTPHYRKGNTYRVWPTYDFEAPIVDSLTGVTHALRSKEYELRDELYAAVLDAVHLRKPVVYDFSRLALKGTVLSKRLVKPLIEAGKVSGWNDPRLPTLAGLRRRGLLPQAIKEFVLSFGLSKVESKPNWEALLSHNRKLLDPLSERRFFVAHPLRVNLLGNVAREVVLKNHPHDPSKGTRKVEVRESVFISLDDVPANGGLLRLKDFTLVQVRREGSDWVAERVDDSSVKTPVVQWVSAYEKEHATARILKPADLLNEKGEFNEDSLQVIEGVCEASCKELADGQVIQFERVGFVRLDESKNLSFIYSC